MVKYRQTLLALLLIVVYGAANAQNTSVSPNNTNSPYTRYGYGQLEDPISGNSRAMGGVAYGLRDRYQINFANPASYTAVDSLTFIFDGGISLQNTNISNGVLKQNVKNSSFDYIAMQFRASRWAAVSLGLLPYSNIGYNTGESRDVESVAYSGEGGLHQLYIGAGFKILKNLSIGTNISYLWGDVTHTMQVSYPNVASSFLYSRVFSASVKSYKLDFGAQYTHQFGPKHEVTFGVLFSPGHDLHNEAYQQTQTGNSSQGYETTAKDSVMTTAIPTTLGLGVTYVYNKQLTVGADLMWQNWNSTTFMNKEKALSDRTRIAVGAEYMPNPMGRSYLSHIKYRIGAYYSQPYYKLHGARAADEYGITAGFGLPVPRTRSILSLSAQYVRTDGKKSTYVDENTFRICVGVTFNERWFFKRKVD